uniref:Uncharacterized protein n=1 Tax=Lygus hesperus TaxID=30085 RepID=A0A146M6V8_LYGHE
MRLSTCDTNVKQLHCQSKPSRKKVKVKLCHVPRETSTLIEVALPKAKSTDFIEHDLNRNGALDTKPITKRHRTTQFFTPGQDYELMSKKNVTTSFNVTNN